MTLDSRSPDYFRKYHRKYRTFLRGKDVSRRTFYIDGRRKVLGMYLHNESNQPFLNEKHEIAREFVHHKSIRLVKVAK